MSAGSFSSIAPYLPLRSIGGSLKWTSSVEYALKSVVRGPDTSKVNSAMALFDVIEDLRHESGEARPISPQVAVGLSRLCDEMEDAKEFFDSTLPQIATLALHLPDMLDHHEREVKSLSDDIRTSLMLRVLLPHQPGMVLLHQHLIAALLACAFLCLYPQTRAQRQVGLDNINFDGLYLGASKASNLQKLLCLVHYFKKVGKNMPEGTVSFERKVLPLKDFRFSGLNGRVWKDSKKPLCEIKVIDNGSIEDAGSDYLQVDFANRKLGGGALHMGCVQEEIRFMVCPECIAGMLFLPAMMDNESIEIIGVESYSQHAGYGLSFRFSGDCTDNTPRDSWGRRMTCVGAIDALCRPGENQFEEDLMIREMNKAYCGFLNHSALCGYCGAPDARSTKVVAVGLGDDLPTAEASEVYSESGPHDANSEVRLHTDSVGDTSSFMDTDEKMNQDRSKKAESMGRLHPDIVDDTSSFMDTDEKMSQDRSEKAESMGTCVMHQQLKGVSTGNWGAGAFGGNLQLKSLLQWLAASQAECSTLLYYSFGDSRSRRLQEVVDWIRKEGWHVPELWSKVQEYGKCRLNRKVKSEIYEWILPHKTKGLYSIEPFLIRKGKKLV